ncbi:sarcosine oxidase subunit delta [Hoeflea sp. TYP-13]|uniref:sarcosine oxidase subunit delta n=1 Tax=Hoeflea sp. TYP-13 TaxID=3230023 RepID=UPI0034C69A30
MRIECPCCGLRDHREFEYGGDALRSRPALDDTGIDRWSDYVFLRRNPRGLHYEFWQHTDGCHQWIVVQRDTVSHEIVSVQLAADAPDAERSLGELKYG